MKTNLLDEEKLIEAAESHEKFTGIHSDSYSFIQGAHYASEELEKKLPGWMPVKEGLPEIGQYVLAYCDEKVFQPTNYIIAEYTKYGFTGNSSVIHWMPLPELIKVKKE